jgi:hypothetical protein
MRYLVVRLDSGGNHGHKLKDLMSGEVISRIAGFKHVVLPDNQLDIFALGSEDLREPPADLPVIDIRSRAMHGLSWEQLKGMFTKLPTECVINISDATRVFPWQMIGWEREGLIPAGMFDQHVVDTTNRYVRRHADRKLMWDPDACNVAIHAAFYPHNTGPTPADVRYIFPLEYYARIIHQLQEVLEDPTFWFFCERADAELLDRAFPEHNIVAGPDRILKYRGNEQHYLEPIHKAFHHMVHADVLVTCNSSFSVMATYFRDGRPTIYHPHAHLKDLPTNGFYLPTDEHGTFDASPLY